MLIRLIVAGFTVLLYDISLTFENELQSVWNSRRNILVKFLYLMNRYGTLAYTLFYVVGMFHLEIDELLCLTRCFL